MLTQPKLPTWSDDELHDLVQFEYTAAWTVRLHKEGCYELHMCVLSVSERVLCTCMFCYVGEYVCRCVHECV